MEGITDAQAKAFCLKLNEAGCAVSDIRVRLTPISQPSRTQRCGLGEGEPKPCDGVASQ
jgi:hypothetical protein